MFDRVYLNNLAKREEQKAKHVVNALFEYYLRHIELLPAEFLANMMWMAKKGLLRTGLPA